VPIAELEGAVPGAAFDFLAQAVSPRNAEHWRWKYGRGAPGAPSAFYWVADDGSVSGFIGLMRTALQTRETEYPGAWFVDWHVAAGTQGVGFALLRKAEASAGMLLTLQGSRDTKQILPRLGWRESLVPQTFVRPLSRLFLAQWIGRRLPSWLGAASAVVAAAATPLWRCRRPTDPRGVGFLDVERFPDDYDAVWGRRRAEFAPAMRRDSEYLNYMCSDFPEGGYQVRLLQQAEQTVGHVVVRLDTDARGLRRGRIVDAVWPRPQRALADWVVGRSCWDLQAQGADYVECVASVPDLQAALRDNGFRSRSPVPIWYHRLPGDAPAPDLWYITFLDCDRAYR
jgi:hypothetical protein